MSTSVADVNQRLSTGTVSPGFEAVRNQLDAYLLADPAYSAQLSVYWSGSLVVDLVGGPDLADDSVTGVFSVSKGISALTVATLIRDGHLDLDEPVIRYWPEFAAAGKAAITVRQLLSHQAGLVGVPGGMSFEELANSTLAAARLAEAFPDWYPGSDFGYHGYTIGVFMEELVPADHRAVAPGDLRKRAPRTLRHRLLPGLSGRGGAPLPRGAADGAKQ